MKKILKNLKSYLTLDVALPILLTICLLLKSDYFLLHPFFLVVLSLGSNYRFRSYLSINLISLLISYIFSFEYGFLITIILSSFFLLKMIVNCFVNNVIIKKYVPFLLITSIYYTYVIFNSNGFDAILNSVILLIISLIGFYAFTPIIEMIKYDKKMAQSSRILALSIFPLCFISINPYFILVLQIIQIMYLKSLNPVESLSSILCSLLMIYFINEYSVITMFSLLTPCLLTWFLNEKKSLIIYGSTYLIYESIFVKEFYVNELFYQGLIAILCCAFLSDNVYQILHNFLYQETDKKSKEQDVIFSIKNYINCVLSPSLEKKDMPRENIIFQIDQNLCHNCGKRTACELISLRDKSIQNKLNAKERKEILNTCITPYKFFKQSSIMRDIYQREYQKVEASTEYQKAYIRELSNVYTPLKLLEKEDINYLEKLKSLLIEEEFKVIDVYNYNQEVEIRISTFENEDIKRINSLIEEVYQKSCAFLKSAYSFSSGCYLLLFTFENQFNVDCSYSLTSADKRIKSGDYFKIKIEGNKFIFLLSDGMGHSTYSSSLSEYLVETLISFSKLNNDFLKQIDTVNNLLYNKTIQESYATLDYFSLDLVNLDFVLFKAGSYPNYIYHKYKVIESKKSFPPLGIIKEIEPFAYKDRLNENDILVFMSDGFGEDVYEIIDAIITSNAYRSAKEIKDSLMNALLSETNIHDDKTLVVFKIEKKS